MYSNNTAKVVVQLRGPRASYGLLSLAPIIDTRAHSIQVDGFTVRRNGERFTLDEMPISKLVPKLTWDDVVFHTFELDDPERLPSFPLDLEISEYDEHATINLRAVEDARFPDLLLYEVEDEGGDWLPVEDVLLGDLLPESFKHILETSVVGSLNDHNVEMLPIAAE